MVKFIKKSFVLFLCFHILLMMLSMIRNGMSLTYFYLFSFSMLLFCFILFCYTRIIKNTDNPRFFIHIFFLDISIIFCFIFAMIENNNSILISYLIWIIIPLRNIMVFYSILYKIE